MVQISKLRKGMKPEIVNITNYRKAWIEWKKTPEYKSTSETLKAKGIKQPYRDNILISAFSAGWGNRHIDFINPGKKGRNNPYPNDDNNNDDE